MSDSGAHVASVAADVRHGRRSALEITTETLDRISVSQNRLNAFTSIMGEPALRRAAMIDEQVAAGQDPGPLAGVPIAVKDLIDQAGIATTNGSSFPTERAKTTAPCVARLERVGAVVVGRTGLHEYAFGFSSENHWFGPVRNPWDPSTSPGGSSGGSGAAVAAGLVPVALGTDTGGSVRVPAALCGVVGLKVTHGRVPLTGVTPLAASLDTVGPLGRSVADAATAYGAIAGHDASDPWSLPRPVELPGTPASLTGLRFGVPEQWVDRPLSTEVAEGWAAFRTMASDAGVEVVGIDLPEWTFPGLVTESMYPEVAAVHRRAFAATPERYGPEVRERIALALEADMDGYLQGLAWRRRMRSTATEALRACDVLVTPSVAALRKPIGIDTIEIEGEAVGYRLALSCFSALVNQTGLPALSVPLAIPGTPPPSVQLIGRAWSEHRLLEIGLALEEAGIVAVPRPPG